MKEKNVGGWDRNLRFIVGGGALVAAFLAPVSLAWKIGLASLAVSELMTASTEYCPLNEALGINTRSQRLPEAAERATEEAMSYAV